MTIETLSYRDRELNWELPKMDFCQMTLLLGISGVGKSRVLKAIENIKKVAKGQTEALGGVSFELGFAIGEQHYTYEAEFEVMGLPFLKTGHAELAVNEIGSHVACPRLQHELLKKGETVVFQRDEQGDFYLDQPLPQLTRRKSFLELLGDEGEIKPVREDLLHIFTMEFLSDKNDYLDSSFATALEKHEQMDFSDIITSELPILHKLAYFFIKRPEIFDEIKRTFCDVFPYVTDVTFRPEYNRRFFVLFIKEENTGWINQSYLSSGMFKTLLFITQMKMLMGRCVLLIDEIENSLGLNCIDILTDELSTADCDDQFIITSHHPYIINNVPMKNWRILSRKGGKLLVQTAGELRLGESNHEAFFQLMNAPNYSEGIR